MSEKRRVSISDIAEAGGVSSATVSRVFSGTGYVNAETRDEILRIAQEMDYQPRAYRKRMPKTRREAVVGVVVPDIENPFFQQILRAMAREFEENGVETVLCNANEDPNKEIRALSMLRELNVGGIIAAPASENAEYNATFLKELQREGLPVVVFDRDVKGIGLPGVFQNSYDGAYEAVECLIKEGHENIAIVGGPITSKPGLDRMVGYMDALKNHQVAVHQEYILYGDFRQQSGYTLTTRLLKEHPEVTAIFSANNLMSIGALQAIRDAGLQLPEEIGFISYGAIEPYSVDLEGKITEVQEPTELMGRECALMMLERMAGGRKSQQAIKRVNFDTRLVRRGSEKYPTQRRTGEMT